MKVNLRRNEWPDLSLFYKLDVYRRSEAHEMIFMSYTSCSEINHTTSSYHVNYMITDLNRDWHQFSVQDWLSQKEVIDF